MDGAAHLTHRSGYVPKSGGEKVPKIVHSKAPKPKANAGEAIATDCILTFVDRS